MMNQEYKTVTQVLPSMVKGQPDLSVTNVDPRQPKITNILWKLAAPGYSVSNYGHVVRNDTWEDVTECIRPGSGKGMQARLGAAGVFPVEYLVAKTFLLDGKYWIFRRFPRVEHRNQNNYDNRVENLAVYH